MADDAKNETPRAPPVVPVTESNAPADAKDENKPSKAALKKAAAKAEKAARKAAAKAAAENEPKKETKPAKPKAKQAAFDPNEDPMDHTCSVGWLKDVYQIKPVGKDVRTRFPPEPNGFLHVGHAKAIAVNFGFAKYHGGVCFLRYDDTNPSKEKEEYFSSIKEVVEWLGYTPYKVTHSSDYFDTLYNLAEKLILKDKAYVCSCSAEEMKKQRGGDDNKNKTPRYACQHRDRPVEESLEEFRAMRDGKYKPKEMTLRMKQDIVNNDNPYMWDMPAYRISAPGKDDKGEFAVHHKTGDKWRIYPTYDFTHCLCDALEGITHSLCTVEFRTARESYDWLVNELQEFLPAIPQQREYGRLRVTGTILSKRNITTLIDNNIIRGWDDPRVHTLIGMRRRGVPPGAIRNFVANVGVSDVLSNIQVIMLESTIRRFLEFSVPRLMVIPDPIKVTIENLPYDYLEEIKVDFMRGTESFGSHMLPFTKTVYIDRSDFREEDSPEFFRLATGKIVGLLNVPFPIKATSFIKEGDKVTEIKATYEKPEGDSKPQKPQAYIQWVAESPAYKSPVKAELRYFSSLFKSDSPDQVEGGILNDINPNNEETMPNAMIECGFESLQKRAPWPKDHVANPHPGPWDTRFQGLRVAYFAVDGDSTPEKVVLNRIVTLKEDAGK